MVNNDEGTTTLSTDKYTIRQKGGLANIFVIDEEGGQRWLANTTDPKTAMDIVEGLILVEHKRFYRPEAMPVFVSGNDRPLPPFLRKKGSGAKTPPPPSGPPNLIIGDNGKVKGTAV